MKCCGFRKSVIPFLAAFLLGIFIAGFFVSMSSTGVEVDSNVNQTEVMNLKEENLRLKRENRVLRRKRHMHSDIYQLVPPPPAPPAPIAPLPPEAPLATQ